MKALTCHKCKVYLGEMERGKLKKDCALLCKTCMEFYETCDSLNQYKKTTQSPEVPDFLKDLLNGKVK